MNIYNASLSYSDRSNESDLAVVQKIQSQLDCISLNLDPKYGDALLRYREALKENERLHKELINKDNELNACVKNLAELAYQNIKLKQQIKKVITCVKQNNPITFLRLKQRWNSLKNILNEDNKLPKMNSRGVVSEEKLPNIAEISKSRNLINKNTKCTSKNINGGNVKASQLKFRLPHIPQYGKSRNEFQCNAGNPRWR